MCTLLQQGDIIVLFFTVSMNEIQPSLIRPIYYIIFSCNMIKLRGPFLILCPVARLLSLKSFFRVLFLQYRRRRLLLLLLLIRFLFLLRPCGRSPSIINPSSLPPTLHTRSKLKGSSPLCDNRSGITKRTRRVAAAHHVFRSVVVRGRLSSPRRVRLRCQRRDAFVPTCLSSTAPGLASDLLRNRIVRPSNRIGI